MGGNKKYIFGIISGVIVLFGIGYVLSNNFFFKEDYSQYNITKNLSPELRGQYEANIRKWGDMIQNFQAGTGTYMIGTGATAETLDNMKPNPDWFVEKARNEEYLGRYGDAIKTLNSVFDHYENSSVAWNNIGTIYEKLGEYKKANEVYLKVVSKFPSFAGYFYKKMIENYIVLKDYNNARKYYETYEKSGGARDLELVDRIKKIKNN